MGSARMHTNINDVQVKISLDGQLIIITGYLWKGSPHHCMCVCVFTGYSNGRELPCCPVYQNKIYYEGNSVEKSSCAKCQSTFDSHSLRVESLSQNMVKVYCTGAENLQSIAYLAQ